MVVAACTASSSEAPESPPASQMVRIATYVNSGTGGDGALLSGVVRMAEGCVLVAADDGLYLPAFPAGSASVDSETLSFGNLRLGEGDEVGFGGSEKSREVLEQLEVEIPAPCDGADRFWLVAGLE